VKIEYRKKFLKELSQLPSSQRIAIEKFVFKELPELTNISESHKIESMRGYKNFYKVRFGDYRIGLRFIGDLLMIERVLHRKEIYRYFP
jgi:mRNA interferase RelE/StbE